MKKDDKIKNENIGLIIVHDVLRDEWEYDYVTKENVKHYPITPIRRNNGDSVVLFKK
jgi:hypothetical protein